MRIFVTGTRGIPDIPGGVEKHCQELYPRITEKGYEIFLATRTPYVKKPKKKWNGVNLVNIYAPRKKSLEAIVHTFLAVFKARTLNSDIIHIHAAGPGLMVPFARLLGLKVVVTNHGPDYDRQKWGWFAKIALKLGEYLGGKFSNEVIVISSVIKNIIQNRCGRSSRIVYNGVPLPPLFDHDDYLKKIGLTSGNYILAVTRFVPEKGLDLLIDAFLSSDLSCQLVIAGDADHDSRYSRQLKNKIDQNKNIVRTGYITGRPLNQLFTHAGLFVLPSFHEGLPIVLLEALSFGLSVLVSDIPANLEVKLDSKNYFKCGDIDDLVSKLSSSFACEKDHFEKEKFRRLVKKKYNWTHIAEQTTEIYKELYFESDRHADY